jgi:hypothetical protein
MVAGVKELRAPVGTMCATDLMVVLRMRVPVQTPTPIDVAVVRPPVHPDAGDDRQQYPCIENAGVEPVPRAARVQPRPRKKTREQGHQATNTSTCVVVPDALATMQFNSAGGKGPNIVTAPSTIVPHAGQCFGEMHDRLRISRNSPPTTELAEDKEQEPRVRGVERQHRRRA